MAFAKRILLILVLGAALPFAPDVSAASNGDLALFGASTCSEGCDKKASDCVDGCEQKIKEDKPRIQCKMACIEDRQKCEKACSP